jgi:hypothetical protein
MSLDPRSRERLEALGRRLPRKLPPPQSTAAETAPSPAERGAGRSGGHPIETARDPERLFHALMDASPDGEVPPHLLDRLRSLEGERRPAAPPGRRSSPGRRSDEATAAAATELYTAFRELLLEDEENS